MERAGRLESRRCRIHNNLGTSLARIGRFAEAIPQYERALGLNPQYYAIHNSLGVALIATGQPDEAIAHFQKALEVYPRRRICTTISGERWR